MPRPLTSLLLVCAVFFFTHLQAAAITIPTVLVGNPGNGNDPETGNLFGSVGYAYRIGVYEVTVGQYTAFLNAVAAADTFALYNPAMATDLTVAGILRSGDAGSFSYSVIGSAEKPVTYVNWGDAARFANWLQNGQPIGSQGTGTTEAGAYNLNGAVSNAQLIAVTRSASARWFLPSENEWYKAAYHQPAGQGGDVDDFWLYPTRTNSEPNSDQPPADPGIQANAANFYRDSADVGFNDGYAVTGSTDYNSSQNYLTDAGAYAFAPGPYGTFDQGGNVAEWNETLVEADFFGVRGGSFIDGFDSGYLESANQSFGFPTLEDFSHGFRMAALAELRFPGDANGDQVVDFADLGILLNNYDQPGTFSTGDFDASGIVDFSDLGILLNNYGQQAPQLAPAAAVPEPGTLVLAALGAFGLLISARKKSVRAAERLNRTRYDTAFENSEVLLFRSVAVAVINSDPLDGRATR